MRLKITRALKGSIDGIQLTNFVPGRIYDVSAEFGSYLLAERAAEPVPDPPSDDFYPPLAGDWRRPIRSRPGE